MRRKFLISALVLFAWAGSLSRASTTITVNNNSDGFVSGANNFTLRMAITNANSDTVAAHFPYIISVPPGTYKLTLHELAIGPGVIGSGLGNKILILGTGTAANTVITQSDGASRVFDLDPNGGGSSSFALANLTIAGGNDTFNDDFGLQGDGGGGVLTGDAGNGGDQLFLTNCVFANNKASGSATGSAGGAVFSDGGSVVVSGCVFTNNTFAVSGTAIWLGAGLYFIADDPGDKLTMINSVFVSNSIPSTGSHLAQGGAVAVDNGNDLPQANITNCFFGGNTITSAQSAGADDGGGALYLGPGSTNNIIGCTFINNQANGTVNRGGAVLCVEGTTNLFKYCRFVGNSVAGGGSGANIYINTAQGPFAANDNWWASNTGPGSSISGTNTTTAKTPAAWLFLTNTASSSSDLAGVGDTLTASFLKDSAGNSIAAGNLSAITNLAVSFGGTDGSISSAQTVIQSTGTATATFTGTTAGAGSGSATVDGVTSSAGISVEPVVTSVTANPANGNANSGYYKAGETVPITVTFSSAVTVSGTPKLALNTGETASYASGGGTATLTFNYIVVSGDTTPALDYSATGSLTLNGGSITGGGVTAVLTLPTPGAAGSLAANVTIVIDTTAPTVAIGSPNVTITNSSGTISYTVTWADANLNSSSISLSGGQVTVNTTGTATTGTPTVTGSGTTRTVSVGGLAGNGTISISIPSGTASDLAGNAAPAAGPGSTATVDTTAPAVTISSPTPTATTNGTGASVTFTVTYFDANFRSASLSAGSITVTGTETVAGAVSGVVGGTGSATGTNYAVTIQSITGHGALGISIASGTATDLAGNSAGAASSSVAAKIMSVPFFTGDYIMANRSYYKTAGLVLLVRSNGVTQNVLNTTLYDPYSVALAAGGDVYVACYQTPTAFYSSQTADDGGVYKIDQYSLAVSQIAASTNFVSDHSTNFVTPFGLAVEPNGKILVADLDAYTNLDANFTDGTVMGGAIFRLDPVTGALTVLSTNGPSKGSNFCFLGGIAVGTNGGSETIYVTDHGDGVSPAKLIRIDPVTGVQTVMFSGAPLASPDGLAVDPNGSMVTNIVVADPATQALIQISTNAASGGSWIATPVPITGGAFAFPTHVAIDPGTGDFLVTDGEPATLANENAGTLWRVFRSDYSMHSLSTGGFFEQPRGILISP